MTTSRPQLPRPTRSLDPYSVLGVARDASATDLARARRRLAKRYHPDLHPGPDASERMRRINEAFDLLASADRRARYDATAQRPTWVTPQGRERATAQRGASRSAHASHAEAPASGPWRASQRTPRRPGASTAGWQWAAPPFGTAAGSTTRGRAPWSAASSRRKGPDTGAGPVRRADPVPGADLGALLVAAFALVLLVSGCLGNVFRAALAG